MKVSNTSASIARAHGSRTAGVSASQFGQRKPGFIGAAADRIQLSNLSGSLAASGSDSPEHAGKLAALQSAVSGGGYRVDALAVSAGIIKDSIQFSGAHLL